MKREFVLEVNGEVKSITATVKSIEELVTKVKSYFGTEDVKYLGMCEA